MGAFRILWTALVSLYENTLVLLAGNLAALALNVPVGLLLFAVGLVLTTSTEADRPSILSAAAVLGLLGLLPLLPTPGNVALAGLTRVAAGPDVPHVEVFREALRQRWQLALRCTLVSVVVLGALVWNVTFYVSVGAGWVPFISILWLYVMLFWLGLHIYVIPLMVHVREPRVFDLYKRATFIAIGHPGTTLVLLLALVLLAIAAVIFIPVYLLVAPALISLAQAHALREIRRRHGDLVAEVHEEVSRL